MGDALIVGGNTGDDVAPGADVGLGVSVDGLDVGVGVSFRVGSGFMKEYTGTDALTAITTGAVSGLAALIPGFVASRSKQFGLH